MRRVAFGVMVMVVLALGGVVACTGSDESPAESTTSVTSSTLAPGEPDGGAEADVERFEERTLLATALDADETEAVAWASQVWTAEATGEVRLRLEWSGPAVLGLDVRRADDRSWLADTQGASSPIELTVDVRAGVNYAASAWATRGRTEVSLSLVEPVGGGGPGGGEPDEPNEAPNVVIINLDDARFDALEVMPRVTEWFSDGRSYTNALVASPTCCPSRASLMSGQYVHNNGQRDQDTPTYDQDNSIQRYLHEAGWFTGHAGKYLHYQPLRAVAPYWDRWTHFAGGYDDIWVNLDGRTERSPVYSTTLVFDRAVDYVEDFEERDDERPFYLHLTPVAPHSPRTPEPRFADAPVPEWEVPPSVGEADRRDKPRFVSFLNVGEARGRQIRAEALRTLMSVDEGVDRLMVRLDELGELDNTLVIFTSDNGYFFGEHGRSSKFLPYTEAVRVPFLMRWPGQVPVGQSAELVSHVDIAPTVLAVAGVEAAHEMDGFDLLAPERQRDDLLVEYYEDPANNNGVPDWASMRNRFRVYTEYYDDDDRIVIREYYNLVTDPWEMENLLGDGDPANDPDVDELSAQLAQMRTCAGSDCP